MFPITSRYYNIPTGRYEAPDGRTTVYLRRRMGPPPARLHKPQLDPGVDGQRLDQTASQFLGDPKQFWRIADANNAMQPDDLTQKPGSTIRITLPEGTPGIQNA